MEEYEGQENLSDEDDPARLNRIDDFSIQGPSRIINYTGTPHTDYTNEHAIIRSMEKQ